MISDHCGLVVMGNMIGPQWKFPKGRPPICRGPHRSAVVPCVWQRLMSCGDVSVCVGIQGRGERPGRHMRARQARHASDSRRGTNPGATNTGSGPDSMKAVDQSSRRDGIRVGGCVCGGSLLMFVVTFRNLGKFDVRNDGTPVECDPVWVGGVGL